MADAEASTSILPAEPIEDNVDFTEISKSQRKKIARRAAWDANKLERRAAEKERRKRNKQTRKEEGIPLKKKRKIAPSERVFWNGRVVLELAWDSKMVVKEITSMTSQIYNCFSATRSSMHSIPLMCTSFADACKTRMDTILHSSHLSWPDNLISFTEDSLQTCMDDGRIDKSSVVYLTADSRNVIDDLVEGETYIIGGIVDRNRYKNLCLDHANALGVRHAKLPIGTYVKNMSSRKVLTVNQVYEILLEWIDSRDWEKAFYKVIPQRKFDKPDLESDDDAEQPDKIEPKQPSLHDSHDDALVISLDSDGENAEPQEVENDS